MKITQYGMNTIKPAAEWEEAFPIGNGHIGAMVYGSVPSNRIALSENTFYSGRREKGNFQETAAVSFVKMREAAERNAFESVHNEAEHFVGKRGNYGTNLPVGSLWIHYGTEEDNICLKQRSLNIQEGITESCMSVVSMTGIEKNEIEEQVFVSNPDHVLAIKISGNLPMQAAFSMELSQYGDTECFAEPESGIYMRFHTHAYEQLHCDELCGTALEGTLQFLTDGDEQLLSMGTETKIQIVNATYIYAFLTMQTDFAKQMGLLTPPCFILPGKLKADIYEKMLMKHCLDVKEFMDRSTLSIEEVAENSEEGTDNIPFMYQYGRYLLLCSSREDSVLPAHLQGIWNDNVACRIGWTCDMHLDINTQMNYWPADVANLSETITPVANWLKEAVAPMGEITAKTCYGMNGWVGEIVSNAWGYAFPYWASPIAPCPTGGVWLLTQLYEHYRFHENRNYLEEIVYPLLEGAVEFFLTYVFQNADGMYSSGPSISPENSFVFDQKMYQISNGCTYEILMIRELFQIFLEASERIEKNDSKHSRMMAEVTKRLQLLLPYRVTMDGTIAEYAQDFEIPDRQHRHTSHLLGVYPFAQITPEKSPKLCEAVENTIMQKITPIENWEDTGWASSMLMLYEARLLHGNQAYMHIKRVLKKLKGCNQMIFHPPTRGAYSFEKVYELDGNTGMTTAIAEMLLQSQNGYVRLLPALPNAWESGSFSGIRARGGLSVSVKWRKGIVTEYQCVSLEHTRCIFKWNGMEQELLLEKNVPYIWKEKNQ